MNSSKIKVIFPVAIGLTILSLLFTNATVQGKANRILPIDPSKCRTLPPVIDGNVFIIDTARFMGGTSLKLISTNPQNSARITSESTLNLPRSIDQVITAGTVENSVILPDTNYIDVSNFLGKRVEYIAAQSSDLTVAMNLEVLRNQFENGFQYFQGIRAGEFPLAESSGFFSTFDLKSPIPGLTRFLDLSAKVAFYHEKFTQNRKVILPMQKYGASSTAKYTFYINGDHDLNLSVRRVGSGIFLHESYSDQDFLNVFLMTGQSVRIMVANKKLTFGMESNQICLDSIDGKLKKGNINVSLSELVNISRSGGCKIESMDTVTRDIMTAIDNASLDCRPLTN